MITAICGKQFRESGKGYAYHVTNTHPACKVTSGTSTAAAPTPKAPTSTSKRESWGKFTTACGMVFKTLKRATAHEHKGVNCAIVDMGDTPVETPKVHPYAQGPVEAPSPSKPGRGTALVMCDRMLDGAPCTHRYEDSIGRAIKGKNIPRSQAAHIRKVHTEAPAEAPVGDTTPIVVEATEPELRAAVKALHTLQVSQGDEISTLRAEVGELLAIANITIA